MDSELKRKAYTLTGNGSLFMVVLLVQILFIVKSAPAQDIHCFLGFYPPPIECTNCHSSLLVDNHKGDCWSCHEISYSLKFCTLSYPQGFDFTTVCLNSQTPLKEPFSCAGCHVNPGDHTLAHDQTLLPSGDCSQCHVADVPLEHEKYNLDCSICHHSSDSMVKDAIARGKSGIAIYCADCHGQIDHQAHENSFVPQESCANCHSTRLNLKADLVNEHAEKNLNCDTCHNSTDPVVSAAISKGTAGEPVMCADCHTQFNNHALQHDQTTLTSQECGTCHVANAVVEHQQSHDVHNIGCLQCHTSGDAGIAAAIDKGMAGQSVSCEDCHLITPNRDPIANCGPDLDVWEGLPIQFSGPASHDHDGTIVNYQWDFGDGTPGLNGVTATHTYTAEGEYQVRLTVTDDQGATDIDTCQVTVSVPKIRIRKVWTTDLNNVAKTSFTPGEKIRYHVRFTVNGTFFTKALVTVQNTSGENWLEKYRKKKTLSEGKYHWKWDKAIPLEATAGSTADVKIVIKVFDESGETLLRRRKKTASINIQ